ncbi:hypothetical protein GCM10009743_07730 [Kribbella swartbergensis]
MTQTADTAVNNAGISAVGSPLCAEMGSISNTQPIAVTAAKPTTTSRPGCLQDAESGRLLTGRATIGVVGSIATANRMRSLDRAAYVAHGVPRRTGFACRQITQVPATASGQDRDQLV